MLLYLRRWLAPPVFPDAEVKTQRANVLNAALLTTAALAAMILAGNLLGGTTPLVVNLADVAAIVIFFVLRGWLQRGQLSLAGAALLGMDLAGTTLLVALLGTIRTPTTAFYLLIVVGGGLLFDVRGILVTTAASSLAVFGLIAAENAGLLPQPDYAVTITQWITYSALFGLSGGLTHVALQATRQALAHAEQQLAERCRAEDQREAALAALQQSEGLYHTLVETLPLNIFRKDTAGRLTFANTLYCRTQGWPLDEVLGKTDYDLHPRELADKYKVDDERIIASGEPFGTVEVHQPIDGPQSYVQVIKVPLFAADGRVMGIQGAFWDVTARQQVEEVLRQSRSNLQTILDNFPFMAWLKDTEGRFVAVNEPFAHACGRSSPDDVIGKTDPDVWSAELAASYRADDFEVMRSRQKKSVEELVADRGVEKWFETFKAPLFDLNGSVTGTTGFSRDITERKQMEEKLQQRTQTLSALQATLLDVASPHPLPDLLNLVVERAASLLDSTSGGLYLCDPERQEVKCVVSHQTLRDYTGVVLRYGEGAAGMVAQSGQPLIIEDYRTWPGRAHVFDADEPFSAVLSMPMWWHGQITGVIHVLRSDERRPFSIGDVELLGLFANHAAIAVEQARLTASLEQELIERERADAALRELNAALEERVDERTRELLDTNLRLTELDRFKDEFISRISHELRTPLANIKIYLNLLAQGKLEKREQYLLTLNEQADKLQHLIDDLLDVAYLNVDALAAHRVQLDVNALAHELVTDRTAQAHDHELALTLVQESDLPRVTTDRALLRQVLVNVVANALSYTPHGGSVTLRTARQMWAGSAWVTIEVRDSGPGIAEQDLPHIYEPFYRGVAANDYKTPGTGVGLTIARRILEQLGGRITVESQPGQGATFTIWLHAE